MPKLPERTVLLSLVSAQGLRTGTFCDTNRWISPPFKTWPQKLIHLQRPACYSNTIAEPDTSAVGLAVQMAQLHQSGVSEKEIQSSLQNLCQAQGMDEPAAQGLVQEAFHIWNKIVCRFVNGYRTRCSINYICSARLLRGLRRSTCKVA
jgi:hypothetical protein